MVPGPGLFHDTTVTVWEHHERQPPVDIRFECGFSQQAQVRSFGNETIGIAFIERIVSKETGRGAVGTNDVKYSRRGCVGNGFLSLAQATGQLDILGVSGSSFAEIFAEGSEFIEEISSRISVWTADIVDS